MDVRDRIAAPRGRLQDAPQCVTRDAPDPEAPWVFGSGMLAGG